MQVFAHLGLTQVESADGEENFAVRACLKGEHTLTQLREVLARQLIGPIQEDMRRGAYRLISIRPEAVIVHPKCCDQMEQEAIVACIMHSGSADKTYLDERHKPDYSPRVWHTHIKTMSTVCVEEGIQSTIFVNNETEFLDLLESKDEFKAARMSSCSDDIFNVGRTKAARAADQLWEFAYNHPPDSPLRLAVSHSKEQLVGKTIIPAELGTVNVFAKGAIHAAADYKGTAPPGILFAQKW